VLREVLIVGVIAPGRGHLARAARRCGVAAKQGWVRVELKRYTLFLGEVEKVLERHVWLDRTKEPHLISVVSRYLAQSMFIQKTKSPL
jgi:hypothetical protein